MAEFPVVVFFRVGHYFLLPEHGVVHYHLWHHDYHHRHRHRPVMKVWSHDDLGTTTGQHCATGATGTTADTASTGTFTRRGWQCQGRVGTGSMEARNALPDAPAK